MILLLDIDRPRYLERQNLRLPMHPLPHRLGPIQALDIIRRPLQHVDQAELLAR